DIPDIEIASILFGKEIVSIVGDPGQGGRLLLERLHVRGKSHFLLLPPLGIVAAADELIEGRSMTIGRIKVTELIVCQSERIDSSVGHVFDTAPIGTETKCIP